MKDIKLDYLCNKCESERYNQFSVLCILLNQVHQVFFFQSNSTAQRVLFNNLSYRSNQKLRVCLHSHIDIQIIQYIHAKFDIWG